MACYAYFVLTKQEYLFKEASDRQYLLNFYKRAQGLRQMERGRWERASMVIEDNTRTRGRFLMIYRSSSA